LRDEIDVLFAAAPQVAGVLRAMLLGDRNFVDRAEALDFQKTGVFHVLVVAGLHVGALAFALYWVGRKLRLSRMWTTLFTLTMLAAYVGMVEQRTPVLRAAIMAAIVVLGGFFFRRLELLNSAAVAAGIMLVAKPLALRDSNFQLTFVANFGLRTGFHGCWKTPCCSACLANCTAFAHCPVVRAFSAVELPDSRATVLADCVVFFVGDSAGRRNAIEASLAQNYGLGIAQCIRRLRVDDRHLSLWRKVDERQTGIDGP